MGRVKGSGMKVLRGSPAFTEGRLAKRIRKVRETNPGVSDLYAEYVHFVDVEGELDVESSRTLEKLLTYGPRIGHRGAAAAGVGFAVVPRIGTISPWSSKATDIA